MATSASNYLDQAETCARKAAETPLPNQQATLLRSQASWLTLAAHELTIQAGRIERYGTAKEEHDDVR